jgi:hypothetical protein
MEFLNAEIISLIKLVISLSNKTKKYGGKNRCRPRRRDLAYVLQQGQINANIHEFGSHLGNLGLGFSKRMQST